MLNFEKAFMIFPKRGKMLLGNCNPCACACRICPQNWVGYDTNSDKCSF